MANKITRFPGPRAKTMPKAAKNRAIVNKKPEDPQLTIEVDNTKLEQLIDEHKAEPSDLTLNKMVTEIVQCRILMPVNFPGDKKVPVPVVLQNSNQEFILPVYTSKDQLPKGEKAPHSDGVINLPYLAANEMASKENVNVAGIVVNPFSHNILFKMPLIQRVQEVEQLKKEGKMPEKQVTKTVKMSEKEYYIFERHNFEYRHLPKTFFDNPSEFMEKLLEKKEDLMDEMYEEMYQQKRMYPYLPEDFSVMIMNLSESLTAVRIDMPTADLTVTGCQRAYLIYDSENDNAKYYMIEKAAKGTVLGEVDKTLKHIECGESPAEGVELQALLERE